MNKLLLTLTAAGALLLPCSGAEADQTERSAVTALLRKCVKNASRFDFGANGRVEIRAADGKLLGHARYNSPFAKAAEGFRGPVPVVVVFGADGRIRTVRPLPNDEDDRFWNRLLKAALFESWSGFTPREAAELEVDAVTGATYSSRGAIASTRELLKLEATKNGK